MTIERAPKGVDTAKYDELLKEIPGAETGPVQVASFTQDSLHGTFPEEFMKFLKERPNIKLTDAAQFFEKVMSVKLLPEQV